jgi:hypothetical protein
MNRTTYFSTAAITALALAVSCGTMGYVEQGRVVEFDSAAGVILLILDSNYKEPSTPRFDVLPPERVRIPQARNEMGPVPEAGRLLGLNWEQKQMLIFDPASQGLKNVGFQLLERFDGVRADDPRVAGMQLPAVDRQKGSVTLYEPRRRQLVTVAVAAEYLNLPAQTWRAGDEVRYYYKERGQALRLMNVTKTNLSQAGK